MERAAQISELAGVNEAAPIAAVLGAADLAQLFDVDARTIHTLKNKGVLVPMPGRNRAEFDTREAIVAYLRFSRRSNTTALETEKLRLASAQSEKIELQNATARRELIPATVVRTEWLSLAADLRNRVLAIPQRIAARLALERSTAAAIDRELREALSDLSKPARRIDDIA